MVGSAIRPLCQAWPAHVTDSVNVWRLTSLGQHRSGTTAVARGDLSRRITVDVKGEILELKETLTQEARF
jgi:HAMP domain-containing protein